MLAASFASELFTQLASSIAAALGGSDVEQVKTYTQLVGALARSAPKRLGRRLPDFLPRLLEALQQDDDELREHILQTLEQILLKCPAEATPFLSQITESSLQLVRHDPNYAGNVDDGDDEMAEDEFDGEDDDDLGFDDEYSDDEDMSWKVRRGAVKTLNAAITTRQELLSAFVTTVAPILVTRFSEREESVRLDVLQTFLSLLKQVQLSNGRAQATEVQPQSPSALKRKRDLMDVTENTEATPRHQLAVLTPQVSKALMKELSSKSMSTRLVSTTVFREFALVLEGGLEPQLTPLIEQLGKMVPAAESSAVGAASIKSEIIALLRVLFALHEPRSYEKQLSLAVPILTGTIQDKAQRDALEALSTASVLVISLGRTSSGSPSPALSTHKDHFVNLFDVIAKRLERNDSDQELRENCLDCIGVLVATAGDLLGDKLQQAFALMSDKVRNEITRLATVKAIARVAASSACTGQHFSEFLQTVADDVVFLLRQSNRQLRMAAFDALGTILSRLSTQVSDATAEGVLTQVQPTIGIDADVSTFPQSLRVVGLVAIAAPATFASYAGKIFTQLRQLLRAVSIQGTSLDAIVAFFGIVAKDDKTIGPQVIEDLTSELTPQDGVQTFSNVARCIGAVARSNRATIAPTVERASAALSASKDSQTGQLAFGLHLFGEVGRIEDFSQQPQILEMVLKSFDDSAEEVKAAAAFALGNMSVGNLKVFLPVIRQRIEGQDKHRLLALAAAKELIAHGSAAQLSEVADLLWTPLFDICQSDDQATRNISSECLARLTLADPAKYLLHLQSRLNDPSALTRAAVIAALRFTLTDSSPKYDELLAPVLVEFLSLLRDADLEVRRHALFAFNAAAHNKPHLIRSQLSTLQPLLYDETRIRPELMRKVAMGPFTVTQDDGLDLRKNAFETMYTLLDTCLSQLALSDYLGRVVDGLRDDDQVKLLCYLIVVRLADLVPSQISSAIEEVSDAINESLKIKLKDGATKQEVEKSTELTRAAFRALVALALLPSAGTAPKFQQLLREARSGPSASLFHEVAQSASRQQQQSQQRI